MTSGKRLGGPREGGPRAALAPLVRAGKRGAVLCLHVQPGASGDALVGVHGTSLKVRVRAPAVSGKANEALLHLLSAELGVPLASLGLTAGAGAREKRVRFEAMSVQELQDRLFGALSRRAERSV